MSVRYREGVPQDWLELDRVKTYLRLDGNDLNDVLLALMAGSLRWAESGCNRSLADWTYWETRGPEDEIPGSDKLVGIEYPESLTYHYTDAGDVAQTLTPTEVKYDYTTRTATLTNVATATKADTFHRLTWNERGHLEKRASVELARLAWVNHHFNHPSGEPLPPGVDRMLDPARGSPF